MVTHEQRASVRIDARRLHVQLNCNSSRGAHSEYVSTQDWPHTAASISPNDTGYLWVLPGSHPQEGKELSKLRSIVTLGMFGGCERGGR